MSARGIFFMRSTFASCMMRSYLSTRLKKMASRISTLPQLRRLMIGDSIQRSASCVISSPLATVNSSSQHKSKGQSLPLQQQQRVRISGGGGGRWNSDGDGRNRFPIKLMDFPERTMPDIVKSFRNRFFTFLIKSYYDTTFSLDGFLEAAIQAATYVSGFISEGNFADLKGLVTNEAVQEIQNNYADLSYQQRKWLRIVPEDVIGKFVYEIGMMFDDDTDQRFVEITVVLHGCHHVEDSPEKMSDLYNHLRDNPDKFFVCNYRFIREFTKGVEDSWTINKLNHFLPFMPPEDEDSTRM